LVEDLRVAPIFLAPGAIICCDQCVIIARSIAGAVALLYLLVTTAAFAGSAKSGTTAGTFAGIEQGDYAHFLIKDNKGRDDSFIILRPDKSIQIYLDNSAKLKGHKVRVHWREQTIPEAGGLMKTVVKVE
jgi:hypothetical protein